MPIWVSVQGAQELKALSKRLKDAGRGDLQKKLRSSIRDAGKPVVADIQAAVMRVKVTRGLDEHARRWDGEKFVLKEGLRKGRTRSTGLRARVARSTGISQTRRGIRIRVSATRMGDYGVTLPRYLDADLPRWKRWRHPVFWPNSISATPPNRIVQQEGSPYFFTTIKRHQANFRRAIFNAMDDVAKELTK